MERANNGWKNETRYSPTVLIGNWYEDRQHFNKNYPRPDSTYRSDYKKYRQWHGDVTVRRKAAIVNDGKPKEILFHHGEAKNHQDSMITQYDEFYNHRARDEDKNCKFPEVRKWDGSKLAWVPEKSDFPVQGAPTNFGLREKMQRKWETENISPYKKVPTTYRSDFRSWPTRSHWMSRTAPTSQDLCVKKQETANDGNCTCCSSRSGHQQESNANTENRVENQYMTRLPPVNTPRMVAI
jgi:hypothetical protein